VDGKEREDFGLADVFGCSFTGEKVNTRKDNYQYIAQPAHPLVEPEGALTELLINAGYTLLCKPTENAKVICTYVPTVHNQPPEKAGVGEWSTEYPTVVENNYGQGKVLYFANQPDQLSYEMSHPDVRNLLGRGAQYLLGDALLIETDAPESVHFGLTQSLQDPTQYIFSMVNTTSGPLRPVRTLLPVIDIQVTLRLEGKSLDHHEMLRPQGDFHVQAEGNVLHMRFSRLEDFGAVYFQMRV
jgi:hypothetical protein